MPVRAQRVRVLDSEARDGYRCELVSYRLKSGTVTAYRLIPEGADRRHRHPALVLLHDHGARFDIGKEKLVRPMTSAPENVKLSSAEWVEQHFDGAWYGDSLASRGYVVLVPDMLYWGGRCSPAARKWSRVRFCGEAGNLKALKSEVYDGQVAVYDSLAARSVVWAEQTLNEDEAAVRILSRMSCVDRRRIGAFGWSMGAHRCWLLAASCPLVKTGVALCWMTMKRTQADPPNASDHAMMIPRLRQTRDFPDIAYDLAPKPFFFLNGRTDKLFPAEASEEAFSRMQAIYDEKGASGQLRTEFFDGGHHCGSDVQRMITDYLDFFLFL